MIQLFTDTSANLPLELLQRDNIAVLPFSYYIDDKKADYDAKTPFDGKAFYEAMRGGAEVKTSLVNAGSFLDAFTPLLQNGDDVLYIGMSGGISGTANSAAIAVSELQEKYPQRKLAAIDTYAASLGEGMLVLQAAKLLKQGESFDAVVRVICEQRKTVCQYFTVDNLQYLRRGGRIPAAVAIIGNLLGIKPLLMGDEGGHIVSCGKVRGFANALRALAEKYDALCADKTAAIGIAHADNEKGAAQLLAMLREKGFTGEDLTVIYEPVTGAHVGPGTVALFFAGTQK